MRVIAGKHRGRVLASFEGEAVRPTSDRVKESVFQILSLRLQNARVLDLFCGSGALGIEALSRGASEVVFNDVAKESLKLLQKNLQRVRESATALNDDYKTCLKRVSGQFDLIFADPPYKQELLPQICAIVKERGLLKEGGLLVYEGEREEVAPEGFRKADERRYGRTIVAFFAMEGEKS